MTKIKKVVFLITILMLTFILSSCDGNSFISLDGVTFDTTYNSMNNTTRIDWVILIDNQTQYDINEVAFRFDLSNNGTLIETYTTNWYQSTIPHNSSRYKSFSFVYDGEVDIVDYVAWNARYASLWTSYQGWFIGGIILTAILLIITFIIIYVNDSELWELFDWIGEQSFWLWILFPIIGGISGIISWIASQYILAIIIGSFFIVQFLIILLAFGVKAFISWIMDTLDFGVGNSQFSHEQVPYEELTVAELKDEARNRGLAGYSKMNKSELISFLESCDDDVEENEDMEKPVKNIRNQSRKESAIPKVRLEDIAGLDRAKESLNEKVILPLKHKELYDKYGKKTGGGILLFGLPGTGKTMFAQAIATEINATFYSIKCSDIESKWTGEAEGRIKKLFKEARSNKNAVIFFDEFDSIGMKRSEENIYGSKTVQEILTQMQGIDSHSSNTLLVVAATNCPWMLDGALLRPGRFSDKIYIPLPDFEARKFILSKNLNGISFNNISIDEISSKLEGYSGADVSEFCEKIKMLLIKREISQNSDLNIYLNDIDELLHTLKSSILKNDVEKMNEYLNS